MSHESTGKEWPRNISAEQHAGILKEKEKSELEDRIVQTLRGLNSRMTKKEILSLMQRIEVSNGLDGLRSELQKEEKLENTDISEETIRMVFDLIREVEQIAESGLRELRLEVSRLNVSREYSVDGHIYPTSRIPWVKRLEDSELGKNIVIDIAGIGVGAIDSAQAILKFLLTFLKDIFVLPRDIVAHIKQK